MTALELREAIKKKEVSPVEAIEASLRRLEETEPKINSFAHVSHELARESARMAERQVLAGERLGMLHGIPISVKDLIPVANLPCEYGSKSMVGNVPTEDAPSVDRVKAQGGCIIGKTTTSEFGCKAVGDSPLSGITRNPWNLGKTAGGSSSGSAASVAAGITPIAVATDGGGSSRIPSALCGTFGVKPQFGRIPMSPPAAAPMLGHIGSISRTVRDSALLVMATAGYDRRDPFTVAGPVPNYLEACDRLPNGLRIAWSPTLGYAHPSAEVVSIASDAVLALAGLGCKIEPVDFVFPDPVEIWSSEFFAGAGTRLKDVLKSNPELLDPAVAKDLSTSLNRSLADFCSTLLERYNFRDKVRLFFERYDLLASPTVPVTAFDVGLDLPPDIKDRGIVNWAYYTYPFNLTGQPAASVPAGLTVEGLPVGLQLVSKMHCEEDIFCVASALEAIRPWVHWKAMQV